FLGTIYLLEGNLEAALKYWNRIDAPRVLAVEIVPAVKTRKGLLDHAVTFSPPGVLNRESYLKTNALLENLGTFPNWRTEISPAHADSGTDGYTATLRATERNGWGSSVLDGAVSLLSGLPYETIYPSYFNLRGAAINFDSLARWDSQKRRISANLTFPLYQEPAKRVRIFFDARDENWNLSQTFSGSSATITDLNLKRFAGGVELHLVENGRWDLTAGLEGISREFRNVPLTLARTAVAFFSGTKTVDAWLGAHRWLIRIPERRFTLEGQGEFRAGR